MISLREQLRITKEALNPAHEMWDGCVQLRKLMKMFYDYIEKEGDEMDKKIRKIEKIVKKDNKKEEKQLKSLEKADKKRDKVCDMGEKVMKKKKK